MNDGLGDWQTVGLVSVLGLDCADNAEMEVSLESADVYYRVISSSSSASLY